MIIPNTLDSRIPQLVINRGFEHRSTSDYQRNHPIPSCNSSRQWRAASGVLNLHCEIDGDGWGDCFSCQNLANNTPARLLSEMKRIESYQGLNTTVFLNILKLYNPLIFRPPGMLNFPYRDLNRNDLQLALVRLALEPLPISVTMSQYQSQFPLWLRFGRPKSHEFYQISHISRVKYRKML